MWAGNVTGGVGVKSTISDGGDEEVSANWTNTTRTYEDISYHSSCIWSQVCLLNDTVDKHDEWFKLCPVKSTMMVISHTHTPMDCTVKIDGLFVVYGSVQAVDDRPLQWLDLSGKWLCPKSHSVFLQRSMPTGTEVCDVSTDQSRRSRLAGTESS